MKILEIDGNSYVLKMTLNALILFEDLSGKNFSTLEDNEMSMSDLRTLIHAMFYGGGSKHDQLKSGDLATILIEEQGMEAFTEILREVMENFSGNAKSQKKLKQVTK